LGVMGAGISSMLVDVGTFATFTAATTNPTNTFNAGTLKVTNNTSFSGTTSGIVTQLTGGAAVVAAPNQTGTDPRSATSDCASNGVISTICRSIVQSTNVASQGLEPGQYLQG